MIYTLFEGLSPRQSLLDAIPKDMSRPWEDPKPEPGERTIAQALRGALFDKREWDLGWKGLGQTSYELPEWKKWGFNLN